MYLKDMQSFSSIIANLGGATVVATHIGAKPDTVRKMKDRDSVGPRYWPALVTLARKKRVPGITTDTLAEIAERSARPKRRRAAA